MIFICPFNFMTMKLLLTISGLLIALSLNSQTFADGEMMGKKEVCLAAMYNHDTWDTYYEADLKRINGNIGTLTRNSITGAAVYGITKRLTFITMLPWIHNATSQGTLAPAAGFQDISTGLKYRIKIKDDNFGINAFIVSYASTPVSNYNTEIGPLALGAKCSEWANRLILELKHKNTGLFVRSWASYHLRGTSSLERTYYFTDQAYYSDKVNVPEQWQLSITAGVRLLNNNLRLESSYTKVESIGGADIRRNEMPFPGTAMDGTMVSGLIQYYPNFFPQLGIQLAGMKILDGRNIGISTAWTTSLMYRFSI